MRVAPGQRMRVSVMGAPPLKSIGRRWTMFNAVGIAGLVFQLVCLAILRDVVGLHYLVAATVAIELTILHNFWWHVRWTWADRSAAWVPIRPWRARRP